MKYADLVREDTRLGILQLLEEDPAYSQNERVLRAALDATRAHAVSADSVRTELGWLKEQGLVTIEPVGELWLAKLTRRGEDVAMGRSRQAGVARPAP